MSYTQRSNEEIGRVKIYPQGAQSALVCPCCGEQSLVIGSVNSMWFNGIPMVKYDHACLECNRTKYLPTDDEDSEQGYIPKVYIQFVCTDCDENPEMELISVDEHTTTIRWVRSGTHTIEGDTSHD